MDIDGTLQFIINQQAQFVADIHSLQQTQRELAVQLDDLAAKVEKLSEGFEKMSDVVIHQEDAHIVTAGMISRLTSTLTDYAERQGWLFEAQNRSETKLATLIDKTRGFVEEMRRRIESGSGEGSAA